ncbi:lipopolysaccharide biosynthesis protein [Paenibacillus rhizovicinus]|uniref:Lipopolysaccharide biosynthesis protein n=1 Tax=Paenibacillus rhizovicinus TaxID=2704463 RepID=A0A6C0NXC7_9BACL|nr:Wzz/FepE/Etk N-terminal domain-containing protein [Paenibacillus rhizovicinus]QHW30867.1 lipopolysaccharide biosynthesis protein [Paenibacillus rhizovicinus]
MELKQYMQVIRKKMWLISIIVVFACVLTGIKSYMFTDSVYSATAKLIVNQSYNYNGTQMLDYNVVQSNIMIVNSYKEIIYSSAILDKVVASYPKLNLTANEISSSISVSSANDSQVMNIYATDLSYKRAVEIANAVAIVFKDEIPSIMKVDNVTILSKADLDEEAYPINKGPLTMIIYSLIISLVLAVGLVYLMDYLDDTIKSEEDVLKTIDLPMLTYISKINKSDLSPRRSRVTNKQVGEGAYATAKQ